MEYSFIQFGVVDDGCELQLPINAISELRFFVDDPTFTNIAIFTKEGVFIRNVTYTQSGVYVALTAVQIDDLTCFRIGLLYSGVYLHSNLFRYISDTTESTALKYVCNEFQFNFDYSISGSSNRVRLPIIIKHPQFPQDDIVYTDANGVSRLISSKIDKEYTLETEYMPEDWHEKLVIALAHDEVYFDNVRLQKSAEYEINYDEYDELPCGTRLYKASAKIKKNTTIRNNNC